MNSLVKKLKNNHILSKEELVCLIENSCFDNDIFIAADQVRQKYVGDEVHLRGLIEFCNICSRNCFYCGLRLDNKNIHRYRLSSENIIHLAQNAKNLGYRTVVLQSGEAACYSVDEFSFIIQEIKKFDLAITLSIGEKTYDEYETYKKAGADRFLLRIETTDKELYKSLHPNMDFDNRIRCLNDLKKLGYELGTGSLVGLPGQSHASLAEDLLFFKKIDADMVGIGPFIPNKDTPLKNSSGGTFAQARKFMALVRLLLPDINIPATTAMETLNPQGRILALQSGANVVMPNVTEGEYRKFYELYPGKICINESPSMCRGCITSKIESIGRSVSCGFGFHKKKI